MEEVFKDSGTIFSPDYPVPYPDGALYIWRFFAPVGKRIKLKFIDFELRGSSISDDNDNCNLYMDHVEIEDVFWSGPDGPSTYCGNQTAFDVYSTGRLMYVTFRAFPVGVRGKRGFKAHFEPADPRNLTGICVV